MQTHYYGEKIPGLNHQFQLNRGEILVGCPLMQFQFEISLTLSNLMSQRDIENDAYMSQCELISGRGLCSKPFQLA